jgi:hypothetical protein
MNLIIVKDNNMVIANVEQNTMFDSFHKVFNDEIGNLGSTKLKIMDDARPVIMPMRRTPISVRDKFKMVLDKMVKQGVIAKVDTPTPLVNQTAIVHKKDGNLRVCIDPQPLNKALIRERFILPILEDCLHELSDSRFFSKADLSAGYWHVKLDSESSYLTTFQTCHGRYRWLRLPFGLSVSAEIFQKKLLDAFTGLEGVICIADDIIIHGRTEEEHDTRFKLFLARCEEQDIKLNKEKLFFKQKQIDFMGHCITQAGLETDKTKIEAITRMSVPQNTTELRRFIGCIN